MLQEVPANEDTSEGEESFVKVIESFVTDLEATKLMQPSDGALYHPTGFPQAAAVLVLRVAMFGAMARARSSRRCGSES